MSHITSIVLSAVAVAGPIGACETVACKLKGAPAATPDLDITGAAVRHDAATAQLVFTITVAGTAGATGVAARGQLDGAPVLAYAFPTTLKPTDVGFSATDGIVTLAITQHPDFDDSPLWDEDLDGNYGNDGATWHAHWVVLAKDDRVPGGLAVKAAGAGDRLPPTAPKMPMFMDSPGFTIVRNGRTISAVVPVPRVHGRVDFAFDAVSAYLAVSAPGEGHAPSALPMLGVYQVFSVRSGDLSLPYRVGN